MIYQIERELIPKLDLGGNGPLITFIHANGYPPACYMPLLSHFLDRYRVFSILQRPLWKGSNPKELNDWHILSEDLIRFFDQQDIKSTIAIGHSLGSVVSLRAALNNQDRFKALVLLEPVLFTPLLIYAYRMIRSESLLYRFHPLIRAASRRRIEFPDNDQIFKNFRSKEIFKYLDDDNLRAYIQGIISKDARGKNKLRYDPEWEMRIYATGIWNDMDIWERIKDLRIPVLFIRGEETNSFKSSTVKLIKIKLPTAKIINLPKSSHLVPLEKPEMVGSIIVKFLEENL
jgi:pimeloyl-ACP methyl ester carboxylesterase